jgi:hypothetical protein
MQFAELRDAAATFGARLSEVKASVEPPEYGWYPRMLPGHVEMLDQLLVGDVRRLLEEPSGRAVADIGAADGDLGFFLDSVGFDVDLFDGANRPQRLKEALGSGAHTHWVNLDHDFELPRQYELVFLLHVLYHLRNPMLTLETLSGYAQYCVLSTRVSNHVLPQRFWDRSDARQAPVAYLLDEFELNETDRFNFWIFTEAGLWRLLSRTGWEVLHHLAVGNPRAGPGDWDQLKIWCVLRSRSFAWAD